MVSINELNRIWDSIDAYSGGFLLVSDDDHPLSFHIGYNSDNQKTFIVLNTGKINVLKSSKAVAVDCVYTNGEYSLKFCLLYDSLNEIFVKLCWDLVESSKASSTPTISLIEQYQKWQRLFQKVENSILSTSVQKGLIGEILFLKDRIEIDGQTIAVNGWVGPEGGDQDFNFTEYWAEVKTTTISGISVQISSLQQLDRSDNGYLIVYHMDSTTSAGINSISLDEAYGCVIELLDDADSKNSFECKMARMGYQNKDAKKYHAHRFKLSDREIFELKGDFPKLTKDNVPSGVTGVRYDLNLPSIESYKVEDIP